MSTQQDQAEVGEERPDDGRLDLSRFRTGLTRGGIVLLGVCPWVLIWLVAAEQARPESALLLLAAVGLPVGLLLVVAAVALARVDRRLADIKDGGVTPALARAIFDAGRGAPVRRLGDYN